MPKYVSDAQLAQQYSVSRSTIWRWSAKGILPSPVQISAGCTRWEKEAVDRLDAERQQNSPSNASPTPR
jgi:predicted DNA-binding transcriptional regulator AlpA